MRLLDGHCHCKRLCDQFRWTVSGGCVDVHLVLLPEFAETVRISIAMTITFDEESFFSIALFFSILMVLGKKGLQRIRDSNDKI